MLAALLSATVLIGAGYFRNSYTSLENGLHRVSSAGWAAGSRREGAQPQQVDGSAQNLLVIGDDDRSGLTPAQKKQLHVGASSATTSTDTLLVVHVPADGRKATLVSIPRDSYVPIPGFKDGKINAAYVDGYTYGTDGYPVTRRPQPEQRQSAGITLLIRVIKNLTGLQIDHYVLVNFLGFFNIAPAIHGVSVNLCHAVDDTPARNRAQGLGGVGRDSRDRRPPRPHPGAVARVRPAAAQPPRRQGPPAQRPRPRGPAALLPGRGLPQDRERPHACSNRASSTH